MNVRKIDTFSGHSDCVYTIIPGVREQNFFTSGGDGQVVRWNVESPDLGELVARVESSVYAMATDVATGRIWVGQNYEGIQLIDPEEKMVVGSMKIGPSAIFDIKIWGNKAYLALGDGVVVVIDIPSFAVQKYIKASQKSARSIAIHEDRGEIAIGYSDWGIRIFDLETHTLKHSLQGHTNSVFSVQYSPDGRYLVSGGRDAHLKVWDAEKGYELIQDIPAHMFAINHLVYRADGAYLATGSMDKSIKIWKSDSFRLVKVVDRARHAGHGTSVNKLLWMKGSNLLVSGSDDRTVSVWAIEE